MRKRKQHSKEFKQEAVKLLQGGERTYREVADMVGVDHGLLRKWKRQLESEGDDALSSRDKRREVLKLLGCRYYAAAGAKSSWGSKIPGNDEPLSQVACCRIIVETAMPFAPELSV